jgi:F0F1-type ATP synthase epsilon subunit
MQILPKHQPMLISLKEGNIVVEDKDGVKKTIEIKKGFVEINTKEVNIVL